jgi:dTDP-4-amino-4,6-dideoxygalactose transaminase
MIKKRQELALQYDDLLSNVSCITPQKRMVGYENSFHLYIVLVDYERYGISRAGLVKSLKDSGIGTQVHYIPVYSHPYYHNRFGIESRYYPNAEEYYAKALSLPLFADITEQTVAFIVEKFLETLEKENY